MSKPEGEEKFSEPVAARPLRVLVVHNRYRVRGGEDSVYETECSLLDAAGHRVIRFEKANADIPDSGALAKLGVALRTIWNPRTYREIRAVIRAEKPDVVHCHNTFPQISPSIYYAAAREGVPVVQTLHNYRLACLNGYLFRDGRVCEHCLGRFPCGGIRRRCYRDSLAASATLAAMLFVHRVLGTWRRKVSRYIALTEFAKGKFVDAGLPAEKIVVKSNAFSIARSANASDVHKSGDDGRTGSAAATKPETPLRVVYVGRLSPEKGVDILVRAWGLFRGNFSDACALQIIGDGPEREALEGLAESLGISSSVSFTGSLPREAALRALSTANLLVLPSACYEQFSTTVMEAMSEGVASLVSDSVFHGTLVQDGVSGRFFKAGDPESLAAALRDLLADPARLRRMGEAARAAFDASDCRPDRNLARLIAIYASARGVHDA